MIIFFVASLLEAYDRPQFTVYMALVETLLEAGMLSALITVLK